MHFRLQLWMVFFAFVAVTAVRAQAPAGTAPANSMPPGQIKVVKVTGTVSMTLNGTSTPLHENDMVPQTATVVTQNGSSAILVFSNGATTQLGADTSLVIDEFLQDPFSQQVSVAALTAEPTISHTKLHLTKGELVGNVKHLNHDKGSTFTIETPVGAAGIRGTTFRIIFRPTGTGGAFAIFAVQTLEGNVVFSNSTGSGQPSSGTGTSNNGQGSGRRGGSVAVTTGQEVVVTVSVDTDPKTGQVVVTAPVQLATTTPLNPVVRSEIVSQATTMATTVEQSGTTFTSSSGTTSGGSSSGTSSGSSSSTGSGTGSSSGTGSTSSGDTSGGTSSGAASTLTSSIAGGRQINTTPGFKSTVNDLTPGAGS